MNAWHGKKSGWEVRSVLLEILAIWSGNLRMIISCKCYPVDSSSDCPTQSWLSCQKYLIFTPSLLPGYKAEKMKMHPLFIFISSSLHHDHPPFSAKNLKESIIFVCWGLPVLSKLWDRIFWIICFCLSEMYKYIWSCNPISSFICYVHQGIKHRWKESNLSLIFRKYGSGTEIVNFPYP